MPQAREYDALGFKFASEDPHLTAFHHRLAKAQGLFYSDIGFLTCRRIPLLRKYERYKLRVRPSALHACGCLAWPKALAAAASARAGKLLYRMMGMRKPRSVAWGDHIKQTLRKARLQFIRSGHMLLPGRLL